jgi:hypothetical protein
MDSRDSESDKPVIRKRGAPANNFNALRHGFYSRRFRNTETIDLEELLRTGLDDEIAMLRVITRRTFEIADEATDIDGMIKVLGALGVAATRLARLLEAKKDMGDGDSVMESLSTVLNELLKEWGQL